MQRGRSAATIRGVKRRDGEVVLELRDLIRLNRLVRGGIDLDGYVAWFDELALDEQRALVAALVEFALQAGARADTLGEVDRLVTDGAWIDDARAVAARRVGDLRDVVAHAEPVQLAEHLRWAVYLFGAAEGRVFAGETAASCNHWWHRDLTDPRVVADLLSHPRPWSTSMRDDARIKGR